MKFFPEFLGFFFSFCQNSPKNTDIKPIDTYIYEICAIATQNFCCELDKFCLAHNPHFHLQFLFTILALLTFPSGNRLVECG